MAAERSPPRRLCGYRETIPRGGVYPLRDREGVDLFGRRQWHQSDVSPIAYGFAIVMRNAQLLPSV